MFCFDFGRVAPEKAKSDYLENQNKMSSRNVFRNFQVSTGWSLREVARIWRALKLALLSQKLI